MQELQTVSARVVTPRPPSRLADILVDVLAASGVEVVFGLPGGAIAPLHDALLDRDDVRVVTTKHEAGAVFAAAGYARKTGKVGVALVTSGPGILNALTALASAHCDGIPVLLLAGEVPRRLYGRGPLQDGSAYHLNMVQVMSHLTKVCFEIPEANAGPTMLRRALATALSGRPGPVAVTLPLDVTTSKVQPPIVELGVSTRFEVRPAALRPVAELLQSAGRAAIFAGSGIRAGRGAEHLLALADHLQLPVMTTPKGKGVFPEDHPLALGVFGLGGHPSAQAFLRGGVDVLLAVGTSLGDLATDGYSSLLRPARALVHVDIEASRLGRSYAADIGIAAPAELFLEQLRLQLPAARAPARFGVARRDDAEAAGNGPEGRIAPHRAMWEAQQALPADAIYCIDSGEHFLFAAHYLRINHPDVFVAMTGLGSMGSSVGAAIGTKLAEPRRTVAVIMGDGGFGMVGTEVATAVAAGAPIVVMVINDGRLGMCEIGHETVFGRKPSYPVALDVAGMARALGAEAAVVTRAGELEATLRRWSGATVLVVDVRIDREVRLPKQDRVQAMGGTKAD